MKNSTRKFIDLLKENNINYKLHDETTDNGSDIVSSHNDGDNMKNMIVMFFINDTNAEMHLRIAEVPEIKRTLVLKELNKINSQYRYISFYISDDGYVFANAHFVFKSCCVADICMEMGAKMVGIVDECYPRIMKLVW